MVQEAKQACFLCLFSMCHHDIRINSEGCSQVYSDLTGQTELRVFNLGPSFMRDEAPATRQHYLWYHKTTHMSSARGFWGLAADRQMKILLKPGFWIA